MSFESLRATTSRVLNDLQGVYDDTRINYLMLRDKILVARASVILKNYARFPGKLPGQLYNKCCFEVSCQPVCKGSPIVTERGKIPSVLSSLGKKAIRYLGSVDGKVSFNWQDEDSTNFASYVVVGSKEEKPYFTLIANEVEVYNKPTENMTNFMIVGVFANPKACDCSDDEIFVPEDLIDQIEQQVKVDLSTFLIQRKWDKMNNANADN